MYPLLKDGDVVFLQKIPYMKLERGMIVVYQIDQFTRVCHVIIRLEDDGWVSKGINNSFEDSILVNSSNYIGVLTK
jgi:signal peptidase I